VLQEYHCGNGKTKQNSQQSYCVNVVLLAYVKYAAKGITSS